MQFGKILKSDAVRVIVNKKAEGSRLLQVLYFLNVTYTKNARKITNGIEITQIFMLKHKNVDEKPNSNFCTGFKFVNVSKYLDVSLANLGLSLKKLA